MTEANKRMKKYTNSVERKLNLPRDVKRRVMADFISSIQSRRDAGLTDEEIFAELGAAGAVAADLNEQMKEFAYRKSPWRWACLAPMILCALALAFKGGIGLMMFLMNLHVNEASSIGIIGGADGPTAIFVTRTSGSMYLETVMIVLVLILSLIGFYRLGHMRKK